MQNEKEKRTVIYRCFSPADKLHILVVNPRGNQANRLDIVVCKNRISVVVLRHSLK